MTLSASGRVVLHGFVRSSRAPGKSGIRGGSDSRGIRLLLGNRREQTRHRCARPRLGPSSASSRRKHLTPHRSPGADRRSPRHTFYPAHTPSGATRVHEGKRIAAQRLERWRLLYLIGQQRPAPRRGEVRRNLRLQRAELVLGLPRGGGAGCLRAPTRIARRHSTSPWSATLGMPRQQRARHRRHRLGRHHRPAREPGTHWGLWLGCRSALQQLAQRELAELHRCSAAPASAQPRPLLHLARADAPPIDDGPRDCRDDARPPRRARARARRRGVVVAAPLAS